MDGVVLAEGPQRVGMGPRPAAIVGIQRVEVGCPAELVVAGAKVVVAAWILEVQRAEAAGVVREIARILREPPARRPRCAVGNEFAALVEQAGSILMVQHVDVVVHLVDVRAQGRGVLGVGLVPEGVRLVREVQFAVRVAQRDAPVARQAVAAFAVGGQQLAGPAGGVLNVVRARSERHAVRVADLQREDGAGAVTLGTGEHADAAVRRAVFDGLLELVVDHQAFEGLARNDVHHA